MSTYMDYTIINNYDCKNNSNLNHFLNFCATPLAIAFGGRKITCLPVGEIRGKAPSIMFRLAALIASIILFPIGILAGLALIAKLCIKQAVHQQHTHPFLKKLVERPEELLNDDQRGHLVLREELVQELVGGIVECGCPFANRLRAPNLRNKFEENSVDAITKGRSADQLLTIVSLGAGGMFAEFRLLHLLLSKGFSNLHLIVIEKTYGHDDERVGFQAVLKFFEDNKLAYPNVKITHINQVDLYQERCRQDPTFRANALFAEDFNRAPYEALYSCLQEHSTLCSLNDRDAGLDDQSQHLQAHYRGTYKPDPGGSSRIGQLHGFKTNGGVDCVLGVIGEKFCKTEKNHELVLLKVGIAVAYLSEEHPAFNDAKRLALDLGEKQIPIKEEELLNVVCKLTWTKRRTVNSDRDGLQGVEVFCFSWCQPGLDVSCFPAVHGSFFKEISV